ncbi:MAG TPA: SAM-dependent methyltransferase [Bdellovibrionota bacterium]|jgi:methyltransferase (TIGR00027 family)|nr:SAM-dependent methyltransferase [Bdellovibrionota bacterium]
MSKSIISHVTDTAYWVAQFRAQEQDREEPLFVDPYAHDLAGALGPRIVAATQKFSQYTQWSVLVRTVLIDRLLERLVAEGVDAVLNLGSGLDTRPYRMDLPATLEWIEVDYPSVVEHMNRAMAGETPHCRLRRVAADFCDPHARSQILASLGDSKKVLVLAEGVIPYLEPEDIRSLAADLRVCTKIAYWITEYFDPRAYRHLRDIAREADMKEAAFKLYPESYYEFYADCGWRAQETIFNLDLARELKLKPPLPPLAKLIYPLIPRKLQDKLVRISGYLLLEPK